MHLQPFAYRISESLYAAGQPKVSNYTFGVRKQGEDYELSKNNAIVYFTAHTNPM